MTRQAHLVGSVSFDDAETVMTTIADILGDCCPRIPDGETGARGYWIRWQKATFEACDDLQLEMISQDVPGYKDTVERPFFRFKEGVDPSALDLGALGYADEAIQSYTLFKALRDEAKINAGVRFQVSIPTPLALVIGFMVEENRLAAEAAAVKAMRRDLAKLQSAIPPEDLAIQFDVSHEIVGHDGGLELPFADKLGESVKRIGDICNEVDAAVELGIHLCYGDPGHKHIIEPTDLGTSVAFANGITEATSRRVDFIHMAVPVGRKDDAYFAPLTDLDLADETRLILGLVHHADGLVGAQTRIAMAEKYAREFDIATECGFGRRDPATIPALLQIHRDLCD